MQAVKRLEIVTDSVELPHLVQVILDAGATGYTIVRDVQGCGRRGHRGDDGVSGAFKNSLVLVACPQPVAERIVEQIRPVLRRYGGICLLSDAQYILH